MDFRKTFVKVVVLFCRIIVYIHDFFTIPIYALIDKPWIHKQKSQRTWSKLADPNDLYSVYVRQVHEEPAWHLERVSTIDELFRQAVERNAKKPCYGVRQVLGEDEVETKSKKIFKKLQLGDYHWYNFSEVECRVDRVSKGLLSLGVQSKKPIVILAETRVEWIICAHACFRINVPIVTLYATLGEDGIAHGINQTEVTHVITSVDLLPKLKKIIDKLPNVTHIVYMEDRKSPALDGIPERVKTLSFTELEERHHGEIALSFEPPTADDLAILMYTSGSTGIPKGVMITNKNLVTSIKGFYDVVGTSVLKPEEVYIAYLPLAHVLELSVECYLFSFGVPIGFSTPQTLTNFSTAIKKGEKGDISVLKPTVLAAVPLMLDRIRKSILQMAGKEGSFSRRMFDFAVEYKTFWMMKGFSTPRIDRHLMKTYHDFVGGRLRLVLCGGAPISKDTQDFIRCCLNVQVLQGYGMTETAASATVMTADDYSTGRVGAPLSTCQLRLVDWDEGRYYVTDKPYPRGEVVVGGDCVTLGYYKNEKQTKECFKEENGVRWFYTGDIAEIHPNGTLRIIDRKNDLIKLQFGEYVALGKVEAELKTCPLVENICVYGNGLQSYMVALIVPNRLNLKHLADELKKGKLSFSEMCNDGEIIKKATAKIREYGRRSNLTSAELPAKIKLCEEDWTPDNGLVTAALKIRRKIIQMHYQKDIEEMFSTSTPEVNGTAKAAD